MHYPTPMDIGELAAMLDAKLDARLGAVGGGDRWQNRGGGGGASGSS